MWIQGRMLERGRPRRRSGRLAALLGLALLLAGTVAAAAERVPLYTYYQDPPLDARSPGNLTERLARWLGERSAGRYQFVATQLTRPQLDALIATPGWKGAVAWANPLWLNDLERKRYRWTESLMLDADLLVSHRRAPLEYLDEGRSLLGRSLGSVTGHRLADIEWLIAQGRIKRVDAARQIDSLRLLESGRVDAAFVQAISLPYFRRELPGLDGWLHIASQPRATYGRHLFTAHPALHEYLAGQVAAFASDPAWRPLLPGTPRQLQLVGVDSMEGDYYQSLRRLLDIAFERAGLRYALVLRPAARAAAELQAGRSDGDVARFPGYEGLAPGALRLEPAHSTMFHLAITRPGGPRPTRWEELDGLRVALPRGFRVAEERSRGHGRRELVEGPLACLRMVEVERVDVCLMPGFTPADWPGRSAGSELQAHVIGSSAVHLWLRAGLEDEARRLGQALTQLERSGELDRLLGAYRQRSP